MHMWSIKPIGQSVDELLIGNNFHTSCDSDIDFWPSDPRPMHMWSIKPIGQFIDKLLIGSDFHIYGYIYLDLVTPMSLGVIFCPRPMHMCSIKPIGKYVDE